MIRNGLVSTATHLVSLQSSELIMVITHHYVLDDKIIRVVKGEVVLDLTPNSIERAFHLLTSDYFQYMSYDSAC